MFATPDGGTFPDVARPIMIYSPTLEEHHMDPRLVHAELDRILQSPGFANSERMARFLRVAVDRALHGRGDELKEYLIGVEVFDRRPDYDPRVDPIVRVEARRLRAKLDEFYSSPAGKDSAIQIQLPKGGYAPCFRRPGALPEEPAPAPARSVAVLPFVNNSRDPEHDYLCDGITQEVIHALTKASGLRVVAWHSAARFDARQEDVYSIGRQLGVSYVLRGTLRATSGRIRILAQLIDTANGEYVWSESYDRQLADIFDIEQDISSAIVRALRTQVGATRRSTVNPEAYRLYLRGRYDWNKRTLNGLRRAVEHFQAAVALDPQFALGYAGLADSYILLADYSADLPSRVVGCARASAERALSMDPTLGEAEASLGLISAIHDWDWDKAGHHYRRAIELNPSYATAYYWYGLDYLALLGRFSEAHHATRMAIELDPLSCIVRESTGYIYLLSRDFAAAEAAYRELIEFDAHFYKGWTALGRTFFFQGRYDDAIEMLLKGKALSGGLPTLQSALTQTYATAGYLAEAREALAELEAMADNCHVTNTCRAVACIGFGEYDKAMSHIRCAFDAHEPALASVGVHPLWDSLRGQPEFQQMLRNMGLAELAPE
jgi:TolB-like protein